jgi:hypothetical protein
MPQTQIGLLHTLTYTSRSTVRVDKGTSRREEEHSLYPLGNADCLLKNTSTKQSKYVVNQKLEHVEDISFREFFGRIRVVVYKITYVSSLHTDFIRGLLKKNEKKLARSFNFTFRYIDDVLSLNNSRFGDFVDSIELEITYITDTDRSAS